MDGTDFIEFIEKYCLINGKSIELKDYQKALYDEQEQKFITFVLHEAD